MKCCSLVCHDAHPAVHVPYIRRVLDTWFIVKWYANGRIHLIFRSHSYCTLCMKCGTEIISIYIYIYKTRRIALMQFIEIHCGNSNNTGPYHNWLMYSQLKCSAISSCFKFNVEMLHAPRAPYLGEKPLHVIVPDVYSDIRLWNKPRIYHW